MNTETLSTNEAAERFGVSTGRIRQIAIALGLSRKGRDWLFDAEAIAQIAAHTRAGIKPTKGRKNRKNNHRKQLTS